jgi:hypothetical protein
MQNLQLLSERDDADEDVLWEEAEKLQQEAQGRIWQWLHESSLSGDETDEVDIFEFSSFRSESFKRKGFLSCFKGFSLFRSRRDLSWNAC